MAEISLTLSDDVIGEIAEQAAEIVLARQRPDGWLDLKAAAAYAGTTVNVLHKAIHDGALEAAQPAGPRGKLYLKRSYVDAWRTA